MERLTKRYILNDEKKGIVGIKVFESEDKIPLVKVLSGEYLYPAIEKLAAYEDLEERLHKIFGEESTFSLADVIDALEMKLSEPDKKHPVNARILTYEEANKWQEYKDLEEQGLLVRLPDDLFKKVYRITYEYTECSKFGETVIDCENYNCNCDCDSEKKFYIVENNLQFMLFCNYYNELGKTVFLTREEAEKKLEEMKKND